MCHIDINRIKNYRFHIFFNINSYTVFNTMYVPCGIRKKEFIQRSKKELVGYQYYQSVLHKAQLVLKRGGETKIKGNHNYSQFSTLFGINSRNKFLLSPPKRDRCTAEGIMCPNSALGMMALWVQTGCTTALHPFLGLSYFSILIASFKPSTNTDKSRIRKGLDNKIHT